MTVEPTLFISGATGRTGSRLVPLLLASGYRLRCLARGPDRARELPDDRRVEIIRGDLTRPEDWQDRVAGAEAFVHLAHIRFAAGVVRACESAGARRLISLSSTRRFTRFPDDTSRRVIEGEAAITASALDYTILRPTMIFGGARDNNVGRIARWLRRRRCVPLVGGGRELVQPIHIDDVAAAVVVALGHPETTARRSLNIAGPRALTQRALIETVGAALNRPPIFLPIPYPLLFAAAAAVEMINPRLLSRAHARRMREDRSFGIDEALAALPGWRPRPLDEGLAANPASAG